MQQFFSLTQTVASLKSRAKTILLTTLLTEALSLAVLVCLVAAPCSLLAAHAPGPDAFGYTVQSTTQFGFVQNTNGSTRVMVLNDDAAVTANLGFGFNFYGTNYTTVSFNLNGLMMFGAPSGEYANVDLNLVSPTNNAPSIAVLWDDWETLDTWADAVYYKTTGAAPNRQFIVQWNKVVPVAGDGTNTVTFEARLFETSNRILFSYLDATVSDESIPTASLGIGATVGIRDTSGQSNGRNLEWSFNQGVITDGLNLLFTLPNHPPIATNDSAITLEDTPVIINVLANDSDQDGDARTLLSVSQGTNGIVTTNANATVTYSPVTNFFGVDHFSYTITDGFGGSATGLVTVTVNPVNDAPSLDALGNFSIDEDAGPQAIGLTGISTGAANEADTLIITAGSSSQALISTPTVIYTNGNSTGSLFFTPVADAFGTCTITVTVNDGQPSNNIVTRSFIVTINPINDPPTLDQPSNFIANEDSGQHAMVLTGISSGAANEADILTVSVTSSNTAIIPNPTVTYTSPNSQATVNFTSASNAFGTVTLNATVDDGMGSNNIVSYTFVIVIRPVNDLPVITAISNQTNVQDLAIGPIPFTIGDVETPPQDLTVSADSTNTSLVPINNITFSGSDSNRFVSITPATNRIGSSLITITVFDSDGGQSDSVFLVVFTPNSQPPQIDSITLQPSGNILIKFQGTSGSHYSIEASTDLVNWAGIGAATETTPGAFEFEDTGTAGFDTRFYRLLVQ
jgi:hypothetical protein